MLLYGTVEVAAAVAVAAGRTVDLSMAKGRGRFGVVVGVSKKKESTGARDKLARAFRRRVG